MLNGKAIIALLRVEMIETYIDKRVNIFQNRYLQEEDLSKYTIKTNSENATGAGTTKFAKMVDKLDIDKSEKSTLFKLFEK